jgi:hypothetical protein
MKNYKSSKRKFVDESQIADIPSGLEESTKLWSITSGNLLDSLNGDTYGPEMAAKDGVMYPVMFEYLEHASIFNDQYWSFPGQERRFPSVSTQLIKVLFKFFWLGVIMPTGDAMVSLIRASDLTVVGQHVLVKRKKLLVEVI